jgi:HSP20 family protein
LAASSTSCARWGSNLSVLSWRVRPALDAAAHVLVLAALVNNDTKAQGGNDMASLIRRSTGQEVAPSVDVWDPFRVMRDVLGWELRDVAPVFAGEQRAFNPRFDVKETKEGYVFQADLPGVDEKNLDISLTGNLLTISGRREQEKREQSETYYASERTYGSFSRAFTLPDGTDGDHVTADLKNGVLVLTIPKKPEVQPKKINIGKA